MTQLNLYEPPKPDPKDTTHSIVMSLVSIGMFDAPGIIQKLLPPPIEKRRNEWFQRIADGLNELQNKVDGFSIENLTENQAFISTLIELTFMAVASHEQERLDALRNAALNMALPHAPEDIRRKMFIEWLEEMTPWHWKILNVFYVNNLSGLILDLDDQDWIINLHLGKLGILIQEMYPEMMGNDLICTQIIKYLHNRGLIGNKFPDFGLATKLDHAPQISSLGKEFLRFITSPLEQS
ncbi:MAG: hypothetical protein K8L97_32445 [Anaerolineae bacterium]|nr:hypothetical protein [Anaerolineae bacterium]